MTKKKNKNSNFSQFEEEKKKSIVKNWSHKKEVQMQNCNRLKRSGLVRVKRPGTAYDVDDVSLRELLNRDVLSSTISLIQCQSRVYT